MLRQIPLSVLCVSLGVPLGIGCDSGKQYPTAPAPKTLDVKPMAASRTAGESDEDSDDEDLDDTDDTLDSDLGSRRRLPRGPEVRLPRRSAPRPVAARTINGHPKGPRAAVFNAVVNNAMRSASSCFAQEPSGRTLSFRVKMTVANAGSVTEVKVTAGPEKPKIRQCLVKVVKALTFPPFEGPEVSQTLPFTAIRN